MLLTQERADRAFAEADKVVTPPRVDLTAYCVRQLERLDREARGFADQVTTLCSPHSRLHNAAEYRRIAGMFQLHAAILVQRAEQMEASRG